MFKRYSTGVPLYKENKVIHVWMLSQHLRLNTAFNFSILPTAGLHEKCSVYSYHAPHDTQSHRFESYYLQKVTIIC